MLSASSNTIKITVTRLNNNINHVLKMKSHTDSMIKEATHQHADPNHWRIFVSKHTHTHTHTRLTALFPGLPGWAGTRKVKPIWILLEQETVSGSGISWAICKSAPRSRQITTPAPHHSVFYRPDALPAAQPTASKHWRDEVEEHVGRKMSPSRSPMHAQTEGQHENLMLPAASTGRKGV